MFFLKIEDKIPRKSKMPSFIDFLIKLLSDLLPTNFVKKFCHVKSIELTFDRSYKHRKLTDECL